MRIVWIRIIGRYSRSIVEPRMFNNVQNRWTLLWVRLYHGKAELFDIFRYAVLPWPAHENTIGASHCEVRC